MYNIQKSKESQMIYTSYFGALREHLNEDEACAISIARMPPKGFHGPRYNNLAPSYDLVSDYKQRERAGNLMSREEYIERYSREVFHVFDPKKCYSDLIQLARGKVPVICCYEKVGDFCHRNLVSEWFKSHGLDCEEMYSGQKAPDAGIQLTLF